MRHKGTSVLEKWPHFDMVHGFPLDYMHLVCLGVVRKTLHFLTVSKAKKSPLVKLKDVKIKAISNHLLTIASAFPFEFKRKPRSLEDLPR